MRLDWRDSVFIGFSAGQIRTEIYFALAHAPHTVTMLLCGVNITYSH